MFTQAQAEHLTMMATRAPSVHNTQPWKLVAAPECVEVWADRSRGLDVLDPLGRQLLISCGCVLHHLVVAARALDLGCAPHVLPDPTAPDLVARLELSHDPVIARLEEVQLAEAILHRGTYRKRFLPEPLPASVLEQLREAVEGQGAVLKPVDGDERLTLQVLVDQAESELRDDPRYENELAAWVWDPAVAGERDDGLPLAAVDPGPNRGEDVVGRHFMPTAPGPMDDAPAAERPTLAVLTTLGDEARDWVAAGMALSALLLHASDMGVLAQPIGQVTDVPSERALLRHDLRLVGVPQLVLRLGLATAPKGWITPRRPVAQVLSWDEPASAGS